MLPQYIEGVGMLPRLGILFWYVTFGAFLGMVGVFDYHPILRMRMPWWIRGVCIGAWLNLVLTFFAYDLMQEFLTAVFSADGIILSPFWFVLEGAVAGLLIEFFATRWGGEGPATVRQA
jgi:type VI protein secretion system component VasF